MAVIINEFEVVVEPSATSPQQSGASTEAPAEARPRVLSPYEFAVLLEHQARRTLRVTAH